MSEIDNGPDPEDNHHEDPHDPDGADDAAWTSIVANFGDRAPLSDQDGWAEPKRPTAKPTQPESATVFVAFESDDHYVPPDAPRVPLADGVRGAAWLGLLGIPALFLILLLFGIGLPHLIALLAVVAFLASMGYLIATMGKDRGHGLGHDDDDPWDDGARV